MHANGKPVALHTPASVAGQRTKRRLALGCVPPSNRQWKLHGNLMSIKALEVNFSLNIMPLLYLSYAITIMSAMIAEGT